MIERTIVCLVLGLLAFAPAAAADWLVTADGDRVETVGPWEVKGRQVVFRDAAGKLASLRLTEVDLEASRAATAEASREPEPETVAEPEPKKEVVLTLTDDNLSRGGAADTEGDDQALGDTRELVIYTTSWCAICKRAKAYLDAKSVPYTEKDIETSDEARDEYKERGGTGVPLFDIGGTILQGFSETTLDEALGGGASEPAAEETSEASA